MTVADFFGRVRCAAAEKGLQCCPLAVHSNFAALLVGNVPEPAGTLALPRTVPHELVGGEGQMSRRFLDASRRIPAPGIETPISHLQTSRAAQGPNLFKGSLAVTPSARLQQQEPARPPQPQH